MRSPGLQHGSVSADLRCREFCYSGHDQYYGNIASDEEIQKRFGGSGREGGSGTCLIFMGQV